MKVIKLITNWEWTKITLLQVDPDPETLTSGWAENLDFWIWIDQAFFYIRSKTQCEKKLKLKTQDFLAQNSELLL